jgi:hypothetical protein
MRSQSGSGNPIMILPILAILAWMDIQTNQGRNVAMLVGLYRTAQGFDVTSIIKQVALVVIFGACAVVVFNMVRSQRPAAKTVDSTTPAAKVQRNRGWLPRKFPNDICRIVENVLEIRGGKAEDGGPRYWVERTSCVATPLYWRLAVDYAPGADPAMLSKMVDNINDRLIRKDLDADAIVDLRPLSIIINNPNPPTFTLSDYWKMIAALPQNELLCAGSVVVEGEKMVLNRLKLEGEGAGTLIAGRPGAGKTQFAMSTLLSLCMANSPKRLSLFIADIKKVDTMHLVGLPHLAAPIATEAGRVADILAAMNAEMMRRSQVSDRDRSWEENAIAIYIDELATLLSMAGDRKAEIVTSINNLARTGRALGMIIIAATQRVVEIDTEVFANLSRRCVLKSQKVADSNHAIGAKETMGHKLPQGAVSIHDAGDADGELTRGLFVGSTTKGFDQIIAPFLGDIQKRWVGHTPIKLNIGADIVASKPAVVVVKQEAKGQADMIMDRLSDLRGKFGDDLVSEWVALAMSEDLSTNAIRKATGANGQNGKRIREQIEGVVNVVRDTHDSESPE